MGTGEELGLAHGDHSSNQSSSGPTTSANSRASLHQTLVAPNPVPAAINLKQAQMGLTQSSMYMPLKALNTFARDWKI